MVLRTSAKSKFCAALKNDFKMDFLKEKCLKKRETAPGAEKFFKDAGVLWIRVYGELMPPDKQTGEVADPGFWKDGSEKKAMKEILISLRERAARQKVEWTQQVMESRLERFLRSAHSDKWISEHFSLRIMNQSKILIFNNQITSKKNAGNNSTGGVKQTPVATIKPQGGFGKL